MMNHLCLEKSGTVGEKKVRGIGVEPISETTRTTAILSFDKIRDLYEIKGGGKELKLGI